MRASSRFRSDFEGHRSSALRLLRGVIPGVALCTSSAFAPSVVSPALRFEGKTLVAVVAHPDDETLTSPVLARYAREGARVYVVIATDGRRGVAPHAGIPAGDSLATVRAGEAR